MSKFAVIGLGRFGSAVATRLHRDGAEVLAIDRNVRLAEALADEVSVAVGFDATDIANLQAYDIGAMDGVIVAIGNNFEASVLVTMHCQSLGAARIYAKALNPMQEAVLKLVGAGQVVKPEDDMGKRLAEHLLHETVVDFVQLPAGFSLRRISVPDDWIDQSLAELHLLSTRKLNLIQIIRSADPTADTSETPERRIPLPDGEAVLRAGDQIDLIGPDDVLQDLV